MVKLNKEKGRPVGTTSIAEALAKANCNKVKNPHKVLILCGFFVFGWHNLTQVDGCAIMGTFKVTAGKLLVIDNEYIDSIKTEMRKHLE